MGLRHGGEGTRAGVRGKALVSANPCLCPDPSCASCPTLPGALEISSFCRAPQLLTASNPSPLLCLPLPHNSSAFNPLPSASAPQFLSANRLSLGGALDGIIAAKRMDMSKKGVETCGDVSGGGTFRSQFGLSW